jgi:DNA-directed RNA polymerase beta' subunit
MINKHAHNINKTSRKMDRNPRVKNSELYKLQMKYMELCEEILNTLSEKRGILRNLVGGRFNFSNRSVIRQDPTLRILV